MLSFKDILYYAAILGAYSSAAACSTEFADKNGRNSQYQISARRAALALHPLSKTVLPAIGSPSGTPNDIPDLDCRITCNGELWPYDPKKSVSMGECWGKFSSECTVGSGGWNMTSELRCHGALQASHAVLPKIPDFPQSGQTIDAVVCEGGLFTMTELKKGDDATDKSQDGPGWHHFCPSGECVSGFACAAKSTIMSKKKEGFLQSDVHCDNMMLAAEVSKDPSKDASSSAALARKGGRRHGRNKKPKYGSAAEHVRALLTQASPRAREGLLEAAMSGAASWSKIGEPSEHDGKTFMQSGSEFDADLLSAGFTSGLLGKDVDGEEPNCEPTCNGKELPAHGWWPCGGDTEFKCKGTCEGMKFSDEQSCHGVSMPAMMTCKGLSEGHSTFDIEGEIKVEKMDVGSGLKRFTLVDEASWHGGVVVGKGSNSMHVKVEWEKKAESLDEDTSTDPLLDLQIDDSHIISTSQ